MAVTALMKRMKNNFQQGDEFTARLLFLLTAYFNEPVQTIQPLKKGKWLVTTATNKWFVKKYDFRSQLEKQIKLYHALTDKGFKHLIPFQNAVPIRLGKEVIAVMPFIQPAQQPFSFQTKSEREEALHLLEAFHYHTERLPAKTAASFPRFDQVSLWQKRLADFQKKLSALTCFFPSEILECSMEMGQWCLNGLTKQRSDEEKTAVIHGDVAAHNFFRSADGSLYLIDFDLAARAPALADYIQWVNRVLPIVGWDLNKIMEHEIISRHAHKKKWLLYSLFPADIFRECLRFMHARPEEKKSVYKHAYKVTVQSFTQRERFFRKWKEEWEKRQA